MSDGIELTTDELRVVARFAAESAAQALPLFESATPDDHRPRRALEAAWTFVDGAPRSRLQRVASTEAHRAASEAAEEVARQAARACGDAASAAYLHPLARATQVGHILRATACTARALEVAAGDRDAGGLHVEEAVARATPVLLDVLRRYPHAPRGRGRVAELMTRLDESLRAV